jgi:beta-galactosidase
VSPVPGGNPVPNRQTNAVVINEYGWLWLNRDGTPTTLTREIYRRELGEEATPAQRRHFYARQVAALTEFWRTARTSAGVLHFCGLGYSRTNGQTCDNFLDVRRLEWEPEFARAMRDACAPVGLMLNFWGEDLPGGQTNEFPIVAINDLAKPWNGAVQLRLWREGKKLEERQTPLALSAYGRSQVSLACRIPSQAGPYEVEAVLLGKEGGPTRSVREFAVLTPEQILERHGLAYRKPITASSFAQIGGASFPPEYAVDGRSDTRWSSEFSDAQWLIVDLSRPIPIGRVELRWEAAFAKKYRVEVSLDAQNWQTVKTIEAGKGGKETIPFAPVTARYVRWQGSQRATPYGYSLWEIGVFP